MTSYSTLIETVSHAQISFYRNVFVVNLIQQFTATETRVPCDLAEVTFPYWTMFSALQGTDNNVGCYWQHIKAPRRIEVQSGGLSSFTMNRMMLL